MSDRAAEKAAKRRKNLGRTRAPEDPRTRLISLLVLFVIVGAGFVAVLVDLQTVRPDDLRDHGEDQRTRTRSIAAYRGAVVDRNGFALAVSTPSHQVVADPTLVADPVATAALLAPILGVDVTELVDELEGDGPGDRYALLARTIDDTAVARIQALDESSETAPDLVGVFVRPEEARVYPAGDLARAVVGRVDHDERGIYGLEAAYDEQMTGVPGREQYEVSRFGSITVGSRMVEEATAGGDLVLTLDHRIQYLAEQTLLEHCEATGAAGATAVVSDPRTGEILAMAGVRRGDDGCLVPGSNPALIDTFEPGSVMKPVVMAAAVEELGYTADTVIDVPSRISIGGKTFIDHPEHPPAPFPLSQVLAESMNVGTILLAQRLSAGTVHDYFSSFGFGAPTGVGLEGESSGRLRHPDDWWGSDHGSIPIGQGVTVNAAQLLAAYNVLANDGRYQPLSLVSSVGGPGGLSHGVDSGVATPLVTPETADEVTRALVAVVNQGTGRRAALDRFQVAGKTGTAWKVFDDGSGTLGYGAPGNRRYVVSFVGYLPADDPVLSLVVVVDEPRTATTAAEVAAPLFADIAGYSATVLDLGATETAESTGGRVRSAPAKLPSAATSGSNDPEVGVVGSDRQQNPAVGP